MDRWINKLTGHGFNCPDPPKNIKREYYQQKERELKEKNQQEYKRRHGLNLTTVQIALLVTLNQLLRASENDIRCSFSWQPNGKN